MLLCLGFPVAERLSECEHVSTTTAICSENSAGKINRAQKETSADLNATDFMVKPIFFKSVIVFLVLYEIFAFRAILEGGSQQILASS